MRITYNNTTIDFFDFDIQPKQVVLSLSGGCDSAALAYLICNLFPETEIVPFTAADVNYPKDKEAVIKVTDWLKNNFQDAKIKDNLFFTIDQFDRSIISKSEIEHNRKTTKRYKDMPDSGVAKIIQMNQMNKKIRTQYPRALMCNAMTANPPVKIMKELGFYEMAERQRDQGQNHPQKKTDYLYRPFINVDKKFVRDIFEKNNLIDTLLPLTKSCVGRAELTNNHNEPCGKCFWCKEKLWAFGTL